MLQVVLDPVSLYQQGCTQLVSVIPPRAQLAHTSKIKPHSLGKCPGLRGSDGRWFGYGDWRKRTPTLDDVVAWQAAGASVGINAARFPGLDIDCLDQDLAETIEALAQQILGPAPRRIGNPPRRLLVYRTEEPFAKMRLTFDVDGVEQAVEFLGEGQQYVAVGAHPKAGTQYHWDRDPLAQGVEGLTCITRDQADDFLQALKIELERRGLKVTRWGDGRPPSDQTAVDQERLLAPSIPQLREAVRLIPNTSELFPDRDTYMEMCFAIKAASMLDEPAGLEIWLDWTARWEDGVNDTDVVVSDWDGIKPPFRLGWDYLGSRARPFGFNDASDDFGVPTDDGEISSRNTLGPAFSDQWLALTIAERLAARVRYVATKPKWYTWTGAVWTEDNVERLQAWTSHELRLLATEIARRTPSDRKPARDPKDLCRARTQRDVISLLRSVPELAVEQTAFDADPWLLNTPDGVVDLRCGELSPPDPARLCSRSTSVAPAFGGACPVFERFLAETTGGDRTLQGYLQRLAGYALTGSIREHVLPFIWGPGGNGKSVFLNVLSGILGSYHKTASMETFNASTMDRHTTELAHLCGARLVTASETQNGRRLDEAKVKRLTGGDPIAARFMRQDLFEFRPGFKIIIAGNHPPQLANVDDGIRRRVHMVPFVHKPDPVDADLGDKLRTEWPAILAWMIEGCLAWQREGLRPPEAVTSATREYLDEEDAIGRWLHEECERVPQAVGPTMELYEGWNRWCQLNGEPGGSMKAFSQALRAHGFDKKRIGTGTSAYVGVRLREQVDVNDFSLAPVVAMS